MFLYPLLLRLTEKTTTLEGNFQFKSNMGINYSRMWCNMGPMVGQYRDAYLYEIRPQLQYSSGKNQNYKCFIVLYFKNAYVFRMGCFLLFHT